MSLEQFEAYFKELKLSEAQDGGYLNSLKEFIAGLQEKEEQLAQQERKFDEARRQLSAFYTDDELKNIDHEAESDAIYRFEAELGDARVQLAKAYADFAKAQTELLDKYAAIAELNAQKQQLEVANGRLETQNKADMKRLYSYIGDLNKYIVASKQALDSQKGAATYKQNEYQYLKQECVYLRKQVEELQVELKQANARKTEDNKAVQERNDQVLLLQKQLELQLRTISVKEYDEPKARKQPAAQAEAEADTNYADLEYEYYKQIGEIYIAHDAELAEKDELLQNSSYEKRDLEFQLEKAISEKNQSQYQCNELQAKIKQQTAQVTNLTKEKQTTITQNKQLQYQLEELRNQEPAKPEPASSHALVYCAVALLIMGAGLLSVFLKK